MQAPSLHTPFMLQSADDVHGGLYHGTVLEAEVTESLGFGCQLTSGRLKEKTPVMVA